MILNITEIDVKYGHFTKGKKNLMLEIYILLKYCKKKLEREIYHINYHFVQ